MTEADIKQAIAWYVQGFSLHTIAQHYGMTSEEIKPFLRKGA